MQVKVLKSKIHRARVTAANLNYEGSLTVPTDLLERAGMYPYEHVLCGNLSNGARFETYIIPGEPGSGEIALNGAVARLGGRGPGALVETARDCPGRPKPHPERARLNLPTRFTQTACGLRQPSNPNHRR